MPISPYLRFLRERVGAARLLLPSVTALIRMAVFECAVRGGVPRADGAETTAVRFWRADEAAALPLAAWLRHVVASFYEPRARADFAPARWRPDA
jgi:hypothetical protein